MQAIIFPEWRNVAKLLLSLFRDIENIAVTLLKLVKLVNHKAHSVFGENGRVAIFSCLIANNERFILNVNRHFFEDIFQTERTFHDWRLILIRFISLRYKNCPLRVYIRFLVECFFTEGLHTFRQGSEMLFVLHKLHSL